MAPLPGSEGLERDLLLLLEALLEEVGEHFNVYTAHPSSASMTNETPT